MSVEIPSPTLVSLEPGDKFLYAQWQNNPYIDIHNAYLLVVNTTDYTDISYIYLTEEEALDEAMKIDHLENGTKYLVQYTQTQNVPDGVQGSSNALYETPLATPNPPEILLNDPHSLIVEKNNSEYTIKLWVDYGVKSYDPALEKTIFKIISQTKSQITSQEFVVSSIDDRYYQFALTGLVKDFYAISCFNVNNNGVGPLSNVVEVDVGDLPFNTDVTEVLSGLDSQLDIHVSTRQNNISDFNIIQFDIFYALATDVQHGQHNWQDGGHITGDDIIVDEGYVTGERFITGLENGQKYIIKAVAVNINGEGPSGNEGKGVPAKQSTISNVVITNANANGGIVIASWDKTDGTFGPTNYNYKLIDGHHNTIIEEGIVGTNSISLTDLQLTAGETLKLSVTPLDTVPSEYLSYWITPLLENASDNWVGKTVDSASDYTINNKPQPLTSIVCSSVANGSLTYTFVKPSFSPFNAPTKYTIQLSTSSEFELYEQFQDITDLSSTSYTFTGLTNNTSYYARIFATNNYGTSAVVSTGPNQPLLPIEGVSGLTGPSQTETFGLYPLTINWNAFLQFGYTLVNYTVKVYDDGILIANVNQNSLTYTYTGTLGHTYVFGVTVNATVNQSINGQSGTNTSSEEITTGSYTIYDKPSPLTSIICSSVANGSLTYTFVKPSFSSFNAPTKYTIELSTSSGFESNNIVETVYITDISSSSKTIYGLTNNTSYYARIFATNDYGTSASVTTGPNQPLLDIAGVSGLIGPSQNSVPFSTNPDKYTLSIDWDTSSQVGYTFVNYTVNVYNDNNGNPILLDSENTTVSSYTYNGTLGTTYFFGVIVNATINQSINGQSGTSISSAETKSSNRLVAGAPYINQANVVFSTQGSNDVVEGSTVGEGIITFTVDGRYSELLGLFTLILPSSESSVEYKTDVFQTQPLYYELTSDSADNKTYTGILKYNIPRKPAYVIYAVNSIGVTYISDGLTVDPNKVPNPNV